MIPPKMCEFAEETPGVWKCPHCNQSAVKHPTGAVRRNCRDRVQRVAKQVTVEVAEKMLPPDTRLLIGDQLEAMFAAIGLPACQSCKDRRDWLNKVQVDWLGGKQQKSE